MKDSQLKDRWALVTGASSGFGADFARELASLGCHLVLTARCAARLEGLGQEIRQQFGVEVKIIPLDLLAADAPQQLYDQIKAAGVAVDVLINNAGFGIYGAFAQSDWQRDKEMLQLNILVVTQLTKLFVGDMIARNFGYILHVASNSAFQPSPLYATYGASKSYVLHFSEALTYELRRTKVRCTAVCPGPVVTGFQQTAGQAETHPYIRMNKIESAKVAQIGVRALLRGRSSVVPGWMVALTAWISQRAPRKWATAVTGWLMSLQ
jgi:hypothetical protein